VPEIIGRQIAAAAGKADTEGCLGDDHGRSVELGAWSMEKRAKRAAPERKTRYACGGWLKVGK
jgi:hypothetical protein